MNILGANIIIFFGIFLVFEAIFSIIYYFEGSPFPHTFRAIRAVIGLYLVWKGATYAIHKTVGLF